jgi:APA family basic amino acid/polyamine antiporter
VLGVFALYSAGYGNVGSSIYYALGVVALVALGATPVALGIAGILFVFTALTYAEGSAMFPEAGGSASFATHGFNELIGFTSGWALMLSYIVTISISAFTIPPYLSYFWPILKESPLVSTAASMGIILLLMVINIIGVREASFLNLGATILDVMTQVSLVILGFLLLFNVDIIFHRITDYWPTTNNLVFGIALAALAYTGVETMSQMAQETKRPQVRVPKALMLMIATVLVLFAGISIVALSAMTPAELATDWARDPVAGIAQAMPIEWVRSIFKPLVAILAATILLIATNAGLIGISRLAFFMGEREQIPSALSRIQSRFKTPYISIMVFSLVAFLILVPGFFSSHLYADMGALYVFGSLLTFAIAHASILSLRVKKPGAPRSFKLKGNIKIKGREIPVTALLGVMATFAIWMVIVIAQPYSRWVGFGWMAVGLIIYCCYRKKRNLSLTREVPREAELT